MTSPMMKSLLALACVCLVTVTGRHIYSRQTLFFNEHIKTMLGGCESCFTKVIHSSRVYFQQTSADSSETRLPNVDPDVYTFTVDKLPDDVRLHPNIGNGHLGLVVHGNRIHMNGLYNGHTTRSHRAAIPSTCHVTFAGTLPSSSYHSQFTLDVSTGTYHETHTSSRVSVTQTLYAHRTLLPLLVLEVDLLRREPSQLEVEVLLNVSRWYASDDINFTQQPSGIPGVSYQVGYIKEPETATSGRTSVHVYFDKVPHILTSAPGVLHTKWMFLTAIHTSKAKAKAAYLLGRDLIQSAQLRRLHTDAWLQWWQEGRVDVTGNRDLARAIYGSYYYLASSVPGTPDPDWPFVGLSPCGLAWGGESSSDSYHGHVFWDQETWMFPPLLLLHPDIGRTILDTRKRTAVSAARNARYNGHSGLQYPWESAFTGVETCPSSIDAKQEVHISGDVAVAILQYVRATGDHSVIADEGFGEIVMGLGDFWISMLTLNKSSGLYEIHGIQSPDEWHWNVNNSVYTNVIAKLTLLAADKAATVLNQSSTHHYKHYADKMYVPFDVTAQYHPEYDGYVNGTMVKQADVILIGFPLMYNMSTDVRRNDLLSYEHATSTDGPAMTWSMFLIGWLELAERKKAAEMLQRNYQYISTEFQVWTEQVNSSGATNFNTGQGGFLQSIIFGYGGLRLHEHHLTVDPVLPPDCSQMNFTGVDYLGSSLDFVFDAVSDRTKVTVTRQGVGKPALLVRVSPTEAYRLEVGKTVSVPITKVAIVPLQ